MFQNKRQSRESSVNEERLKLSKVNICKRMRSFTSPSEINGENFKRAIIAQSKQIGKMEGVFRAKAERRKTIGLK